MKIVRRVLLALVACLIVGGVCFWVIVLEPIHRHREFCEHVRAKFKSLSQRRPPEITRNQWANVVAMTLNAHANCFTYEPKMPPAEMDRFEKELDHRLEGKVDLQTIDWIWGEIVRLTRHGKKYSDNYRPTLPERLEEFKKGNPWAGVEVD